eukprot:scaffold29971_cov73-Skeletonema_marinoi.AAC.1
MMEQHQEHPMTNSSNMQLHSNEMQLSSRKDRPRYDRPQHPHNRQHYDHRMLQQQSRNDRPQQKQHPHSQAYAQNHWSEIEERLGKDAPNSWHYLTVKEILSNMGKNGWEARLEKYGLEAVVKQGWEARDYIKGSNASAGVRQERADENQQILESLVQSGEPFWIKVKKGDITAVRGQTLFRSYHKKVVGDFPSVQVCHGTIVALRSCKYEEIPCGTNKVLNTTYGSVHTYKKSKQKLKSYSLNVPYGMLSYSGNGNVVLAWFSKNT